MWFGAADICHNIYILSGELHLAVDWVCYFVTFPLVKGFGLTIGSDLSILFVNHKHYNSLGVIKSSLTADVMHGIFTATNASNSTSELSFAGTFRFVNATNSHISRGRFPAYRCVPFACFCSPSLRCQAVSATQTGRGTASRSLGGRCSS
jgi:hypothetical protein